MSLWSELRGELWYSAYLAPSWALGLFVLFCQHSLFGLTPLGDMGLHDLLNVLYAWIAVVVVMAVGLGARLHWVVSGRRTQRGVLA